LASTGGAVTGLPMNFAKFAVLRTWLGRDDRASAT
jgi:hypothetical protein